MGLADGRLAQASVSCFLNERTHLPRESCADKRIRLSYRPWVPDDDKHAHVISFLFFHLVNGKLKSRCYLLARYPDLEVL